MSYMLANAKINLSLLVEETKFASGNLDSWSCTTTMCLNDGIDQKRSTNAFSYHFQTLYLASIQFVESKIGIEWVPGESMIGGEYLVLTTSAWCSVGRRFSGMVSIDT